MKNVIYIVFWIFFLVAFLAGVLVVQVRLSELDSNAIIIDPQFQK